MSSFLSVRNPLFHVREARLEDIKSIVRVTNDAFMVDAFFKKEQYHQRLSEELTADLMKASTAVGSADTSATFFVACTDTGVVVGSIYLSWKKEVEDVQRGVVSVIGRFSHLAVDSSIRSRGVGAALVRHAEQQLVGVSSLPMSDAMQTPDGIASTTSTSMEIGVIHLRADLVVWYERQGYVVMGEIHDDAELRRATLETFAVHLVKLKKDLSPPTSVCIP